MDSETDVARVGDDLAGPLVNSVFRFDSLASTNDRAAELVQDPAIPLPMLVCTREQTAGRGRGSNAWWSDSGSLTFTLALAPEAHGLTRELEARLALTMAVAIVEALDEIGLSASQLGIRWPNDVEANGRKIGGILPEPIDTPPGRRVLIGVGVNVTTRLNQAPAEIQRMATSLEAIGGCEPAQIEASNLLRKIVPRFFFRLAELVAGDPNLPQVWNHRDLLRGEWINVMQGTRTITGRAQGIDPAGALLLEHNGQILTITGGQVLR
jgi:BirA family transcriptional regulator, biotin operon repressor / biotin---[acetyl-CoA-carboxylase] ligase